MIPYPRSSQLSRLRILSDPFESTVFEEAVEILETWAIFTLVRDAWLRTLKAQLIEKDQSWLMRFPERNLTDTFGRPGTEFGLTVSYVRL